jgi:hypothetical protein
MDTFGRLRSLLGRLWSFSHNCTNVILVPPQSLDPDPLSIAGSRSANTKQWFQVHQTYYYISDNERFIVKVTDTSYQCFGSWFTESRSIQHFRLNSDPDPIRIQGLDEQILKKITAEQKICNFCLKTATYLSLGLNKGCPRYRRSL